MRGSNVHLPAAHPRDGGQRAHAACLRVKQMQVGVGVVHQQCLVLIDREAVTILRFEQSQRARHHRRGPRGAAKGRGQCAIPRLCGDRGPWCGDFRLDHAVVDAWPARRTLHYRLGQRDKEIGVEGDDGWPLRQPAAEKISLGLADHKDGDVNGAVKAITRFKGLDVVDHADDCHFCGGGGGIVGLLRKVTITAISRMIVSVHAVVKGLQPSTSPPLPSP